jgi:hypothetical protein
MQVKYHLHTVFLYGLFNFVNYGLVLLVGFCPFSVGVTAHQLCASVAVYHSVDVYHWNNLEHKTV